MMKPVWIVDDDQSIRWVLEKDEDETNEHLDKLLADLAAARAEARAARSA